MARTKPPGRKPRKRATGPSLSQVIFSVVALIVIAAFVLSLIAK